MAVKLATTSGNLTAAGTWQDVVNLSDYEGSVQPVPLTTFQGAGAFTPGAVQIDGLILKAAYTQSAFSTAGVTLSVRLYNSTDAAVVAGTTVTVNAVDFEKTPGVTFYDGGHSVMNIGWVYFKFAAPVTLIAGKAYIVQTATNSYNVQSLIYSGVNYTYARGLVLTGASAAAPTTGDQVIITGSRTGAGNLTPVVVTMDQTSSAVKYGTTSTSLTSFFIGQGGTLNFGNAAATNYRLNVQGIFTISCAGVLTIGTVANPIPRDSTAVLNLDITGAVGSYFMRCAGGTIIAQGLSRTVGKNVVGCLLTASLAPAGTTLNVDRDTGWLSGDVVRIANTQRTSNKSDSGTLNGNAGATSFVIAAGVTNQHDGDVATGHQAEVILATRNVTISSATAGKGTYIWTGVAAELDFDWVAFVGMSYGNNPRGLTVSSPTSLGVDYCHFDPNGGSLGTGISQYAASGQYLPAFDLTFRHNTAYQMLDYLYNFQGSSGNFSTFAMTLEDNWVVGGPTWGYAGFLYEKNIWRRITLTRCRFADGYNVNPTILQNTTDATNYPAPDPVAGGPSYPAGWVFEDCVFHGMGYAIQFSGTNCGFITLRRCKFYRIKTSGETVIYGMNGVRNLLFEDCEFQAYWSYFLYLSPGASVEGVVFRRCKFGGESGATSAWGMYVGASSGQGRNIGVRFEDCLWGTAAGGTFLDHTSGDFGSNSLGQHQNDDLTLVNNRRGGGTQFGSTFRASFNDRARIRYQRDGGTLGNHWTDYPRLGTVRRDPLFFRQTSPSEKLTPNSAGTYLRLRSAPKRFDVNLGSQKTPEVYVYLDPAYNGAAPRLIMAANAAIGITDDVILATASGSTGVWEKLSGSMPVPSADDGQVEIFVECNGTAGSVWCDDWGV